MYYITELQNRSGGCDGIAGPCNAYRGVYTMGEWCEMHHGENWGGGIWDDKMLLLVSIIIYYYMNTFITFYTSALLTCRLPFFYINLPIVVARQQCITS